MSFGFAPQRVGLAFEELDAVTRTFMLKCFEAEYSGVNPYFPKGLSSRGQMAFTEVARQAIQVGNDVFLVRELSSPAYWLPETPYQRNGRTFSRRQNPVSAAETCGTTEFNTWYVRGLAERLCSEGESSCQIYRAGEPRGVREQDCIDLELHIVSIAEIILGHRIRYWPEPGQPDRLSIPAHPNCHLSIRRTR